MRSLAGVSLGWLGISLVADGVPALVVPHRIAASGGDASALGLVTFAAIAIAALVQPFAGAWSDRVGRAPAVLAGIAIGIGGLVLLALPDALLPGAILALAGVSVAQAGYQGLLPDRIQPDVRGRGAGAKGLFDVGGAFLAFALVGGLLASGAEATATIVMVVALSGSLLLALVLLPSGRARGEAVPRAVPDRGDHGDLGRLIVARFLFLLGIFAVGRFLLLFTADRLGLDADAAAAQAGAALALLTLLTALAAVPAGWLADRIGRAPVMLAGGLVAGIGIVALPLADSLETIVGAGALMAIGAAAFGAGSWAALADVTAGVHSGRQLGIANLGTAGAAAAAGLFGPLIDGVDRIAPGLGYAGAFVLAGSLTAGGGLVAWRADPARRAVLRPVLEGSD